ncbi:MULTISPECIES: cyclin-dependent kinase inhibitor 3 family protein [unclassified Thioalkalivibrio]|uniref:cyclin-dependent kinase inhibitor 3 family protein n=1 Tax=unclassified Thioalkalivibrio TaxID=2621013 RepID=UPI0003A469A2|nr:MULTISPECIES: cyclin-dependent kinase inhibitor 3 family protein [unclassified Thioalkalivibrio]
MNPPRTDSPVLDIGSIPLPEGGAIGMTRCPGKRPNERVCGPRDVQADLVALRDWGAGTVVTLNQNRELTGLGVPDLGASVQAAGMRWVHLPIGDMAAPDRPWETGWGDVGPRIHQWLRAGERVAFHCGGGQGRAGTIAALTLIERGYTPDEAIQTVRKARPGAIESPDQERYLRSLARED